MSGGDDCKNGVRKDAITKNVGIYGTISALDTTLYMFSLSLSRSIFFRLVLW